VQASLDAGEHGESSRVQEIWPAYEERGAKQLGKVRIGEGRAIRLTADRKRVSWCKKKQQGRDREAFIRGVMPTF
jgi:hypothetical protein